MASKERRRGHGEGAIFQRQDGQWVARVTLPDGKRKTYYAKTRKDVTAKLRAAQKAVDDGLSLDSDRQTVAQFLERWLSASVKPSVKTKTYEGYESIVRVRVAPRIGGRHLAKLRALDLQELYTDLAASGLSARSVHHTHRVLHRAFGQAVRWDMIARNPCDGAEAPRAKSVEMKCWTPEESNAFLTATLEHPAHALYRLALTTGMRQGELLGLKWADVDLSAGTVSIRRTLQRQRGKGLVFETPKTAKSRRNLRLSQRTIDALRAHRDRQAFDRRTVGAEWNDIDLVFCDGIGEPLDPSYQTATFKRAVAAAGLPAIRFHDMRHTAASIMIARGLNAVQVAATLGHTTPSMTLNVYSHLFPANHGDAAAAMDAVLTA